jgi:hypothetical protein
MSLIKLLCLSCRVTALVELPPPGTDLLRLPAGAAPLLKALLVGLRFPGSEATGNSRRWHMICS